MGLHSLGWKDPLEEDMATQSSILAWRIAMDRGAWGAAAHRVTESDTTEVTGHGLIARDFTGKWYPGIEQEGKGNRTALPCSSKSPVLRWD